MSATKHRSKTVSGLPYHEESVDLADTAAEATSTASTVLLPRYFEVGRPIVAGLKIGQAAMDANAVLLPINYTVSGGRVTASIRFANNNVAAGANINPGAKTFFFVQL